MDKSKSCATARKYSEYRRESNINSGIQLPASLHSRREHVERDHAAPATSPGIV